MTMNLKALDAIEKQVNDALAEREKQTADLKAAITNAEGRLAEVEEQTQQAYTDADTKAYHKGQDEKRALTDSISMYKDKLEKFKHTPSMTQAEFEKNTAAIMADLAIAADNAERHIVEVIDALGSEIDEVRDILERGNALIKTMQLQLFKDERAIKYESGFIRRFNNYTPVQFLENLKASGLYKKVKERG